MYNLKERRNIEMPLHNYTLAENGKTDKHVCPNKISLFPLLPGVVDITVYVFSHARVPFNHFFFVTNE
jgi:hypothetical protein